jgi:hypothetical protein
VALWGRQVMLELPACAFVFWSSHLFLRYLEDDRPRSLHIAMLLLLLGVYTKQTVIFALPLFGCMLWKEKGASKWRDRQVWMTLGIFCVGLLPLTAVTWWFGQVNFNSVVGGKWTTMPLLSWASLSFYGRELPAQVGWPVVALAGLYGVLRLIRKGARSREDMFMVLWFAAGYVFFTLIALKEPRHTVVILFPMVFFAVEAIRGLVPRRIAPLVAALLAVFTFGHTLYSYEVPSVTGYQAAVDFVARHAPRDAVILFSGYRDGSFIFAVRERQDRRDLTVLRSDKLFLRVTQRRELGLEERGFTEAQIAEALNRYGVSYVVSQPNFWDDLITMQRLQRVLHSGQFEKIAVIPIVSNVNHTDRELEVYRKVGPAKSSREQIRMELPIIDTIIEGEIGGRADGLTHGGGRGL